MSNTTHKLAVIGCLVGLCCSAFLLLVAYFNFISVKPPNRTPDTVVDFLNDFIVPGRDRSVDADIINQYFELEQPDTNEDYTTYTFGRVIFYYDFGFQSFELEQVSDGFVEIRLLDAEGNLLPPPIGFWYELSPNGSKIVEWAICRLQPFSALDEEYSEVWE